MATGFLGSDALETSTANQEIVPSPPSELNWTMGYHLLKFSFINNQDCTVVVNGIETIFIPSGQGFNTDKEDPPITSFVIKESGITYNWAATY